VIWGGNTPGLALGQYVNFWGSQWASQVTGGDYQANPSFKGYAVPAATPVGICEPAARTSGSPLLDSSCWTSKPGNSKPPATLPAYIGVIVSTSIAKQGSTIYGNVAALLVVQVDPSSPYGSDPGHPGYGTVAAVIQDGASLLPHATSRRTLAPAGESSASTQTGTSKILGNPASAQGVAPAAVVAGNRRYFFYSSELHLLAESELTTSSSPAVLTEYTWFGDQPVAQSDSSGATSWTFTDHLATPILQTSAAQGVVWRAEYEPYGAVFGLRSSDQHQPLRLPGQEAEQLSLGANGVTARSYNIFRWYESSSSRYGQADPLDNGAPYQYSNSNPLRFFDSWGLVAEPIHPLPPTLPYPRLVPPPVCTPEPAVPPGVSAAGGVITAILYWLSGTAAGGPGDMITDHLPHCDKCAAKKDQNPCPPCVPPVGTIGYRLDLVPPAKPHHPFSGDHVHLYLRNQDPLTCKCYWNKLRVTAPPPPPGAVPMP
jgi:RHS repeat-associated protein